MTDTELTRRLDRLGYKIAHCLDLMDELDPLIRAAIADGRITAAPNPT